MKFLTFIKITLFSLCVYHAQAAALDGMTSAPVPATTVAMPSVSEQISDWTRIFDARRGQDLTTVPMPELMDKVHQTVAYVTPVIQDAEAISILDRYVGEVTSAYEADALTFLFYTRFMLGTAALMNPESWKGEGTIERPFENLGAALRAPLASEAWLGMTNNEHNQAYSSISEMLRFGLNPYFILTKGGHFGHERIVEGYLTSEAPYHLMGFPLKNPNAHGRPRTVLEFIAHDAGHGAGITYNFEAIFPLVRTILRPVFQNRSKEDETPKRRTIAGLYFLLHEVLGKGLVHNIDEVMDRPVADIGHAVFEHAKNDYMNTFLKFWRERFRFPLGFWLESKGPINVMEDQLQFEGRIVDLHSNVTLETNTVKLSLPASLRDGVYTMEVETHTNHTADLETVVGPEKADRYQSVLSQFYEGAEVLETKVDDSKHSKWTFKLPPVDTTESAQAYLASTVADELGTMHWVETGKFEEAELPYHFDNELEVAKFLHALMTHLQQRVTDVWAEDVILDPTLVESTRIALKKRKDYFRK